MNADTFNKILQDSRDQGVTTPCYDSDHWTSDDARHRARAAELCHGCPLRGVCRKYATANHVKWGVWGGRDYTATAGAPKAEDRAELVRQVRELREAGHNRKDIAASVGLTIVSLDHLLRRNGLIQRDDWNAELIERGRAANELRERNLSFRSIGNRLNISERQVQYALDYFQLARRRKAIA